jgi:hypothetical protein
VVLALVGALGTGVLARLPDVPSTVPADSEDSQVPRSFCFDPSSPPPEAERAALDLLMRGGGAEYNQAERWGGAMGSHRTLYWSLVPDGTMLPGREGQADAPSNLFAQMDSKFGGNRALWIAQIQAAVDRWSYLTGITYVRITSGGNDWDDGSNFPESNFNGTTRGDVRIGGRNLDGGSGVLAFNYYPPGGDMVIDTAENWGSSSNSYRFLRNVVMHELGHGLAARVPGDDEADGAVLLLRVRRPAARRHPWRQSFYGDIYEPNETSGQATLGTLTVGGTPS